MFNNSQNDIFGTNVNRVHEQRWYLLLAVLQ